MPTKRLLCASITLLLASSPAWAQVADVQEKSLDSRVEDLRSMDPDERREAIQAMSPEERRGIWFAVKQADWEERNVSQSPGGFYRDAGKSIGSGATSAKNVGAKAVGTITYDDGVITHTYGGGQIVGNRFDTHTGVPVLASGTISTVVGVVQPGATQTTNSAGFVIEGPQTTGGGAMAIFSTFTNATGATDTVTFSGLGVNYTGSSFYVLFGDFANSYIPAFGTGSTNGQGFHGVVGYTGGMGPNITSTFNLGGTVNALVRVSGNVLPVELMEYGVE